ncbi:hypothetical protein [Fibrobacter sp. UWB11]|uniref:hypothetical protein n=1 Tax=Fibrobacter sp. UWB11 TaxID=1896202 RepID=UPI000926BBE5|nr:hypothetical protein [Fibrobacter sp. UWB11]SIN81360.1 hypothetical protein SAMN05720758_0003 [Fibrobacter sp. UWB11]
MQRLLYPLIASALITIVPFLLTFEKGQDIVRGLFGFEYFALLLFIIYIKNKLANETTSLRAFYKNAKQSILILSLAINVFALFAVAWIDLQNLLAIKNWSTGWYGFIPFATCGLSIAMVWKIKPYKSNTICFILFIALFIHLAASNQFPSQPIAEIPTIDYIERIAPKPVSRLNISENFKNKYIVTDSVTITRNFVDTTRNNVVILVESWGTPLDVNRFDSQLDIFGKTITKAGVHNRMYSRTRTAEREDLMQSFSRDSTGRKDTTFLPQIFANIGYRTTFLSGQDSLMHRRYKYIANIGFGDVFYGNNQSDNVIANKIDRILVDTTQKHFIAWTTSDTRFPLPGFSSIYNSDANAIDSAYTKLLTQTLKAIANLASKHPETRFIVQGDHNPILSPLKFQERFYKRWVPFVILN